MTNKWTRRIVYLLLFLVVVIGIAVFFSPYEKHGNESYRSLQTSVEIACPVDSVFAYLGNSSNAANWSAYVDHITPLNNETHPDGTKGSERRCYKDANEEGMTWDERVETVIENENRTLSIYNMQDFSIYAKGSLITEQRYESLGANRTRLTFTLYFKEKSGAMDFLKMSLAAYKITSIFEQNLGNVKRICETGK